MRVDSTRERRPTAGFGWVDHRIVRDCHLTALGQAAVAVYLVLCVVADRRGISYYSTGRLGELVKHSASKVEDALQELAGRKLIAREGRFVQVMALEHVSSPPGRQENGPGPDTPVGCPASRRNSSKQPSESAGRSAVPDSPEVILSALSAGSREALLARARERLVALVRGREPSRAVVQALAAGMAREERGR